MAFASGYHCMGIVNFLQANGKCLICTELIILWEHFTNWPALKHFKKGHSHRYLNDALIEDNKVDINVVGVHSNKTSCKDCACHSRTKRVRERKKLHRNTRENRFPNVWNTKKWKAKCYPRFRHFLETAGGTSCKDNSHHTIFGSSGCMKSPCCCKANRIQVPTPPSLLHCQPHFLWEKDIFVF